MKHRICPWWVGFLLVSPIRRLMQNPEKILAPWIKPGMTVLDVGSGMGFFTLPLAHQVGSDGRVIAVDVQRRMIEGLVRRAEKTGLANRIEARVCSEQSLGLEDLSGQIDFALAFFVLHEAPDSLAFLKQIHATLKPLGQLLLVEPAGHVPSSEFQIFLDQAKSLNFQITEQPRIGRAHTAILRR